MEKYSMATLPLPETRDAAFLDRQPINLKKAGHGLFRRSRPLWFEYLWMIVERIFVNNSLQPSTRVRVFLLRLFGAKIGRDTLIRNIHVKFPWNLEIGDRCWLGEGVWLHNQDKLTIGADSVISQQSFVTTGSHDVRETMDLITRPVNIGRGVWVTSRCIILAGVDIGDNAVLTPGSVANRSLAASGIFSGNPARFQRPRWNQEPVTADASGLHLIRSGGKTL
jgi:putative colanic acid biosynthesis acetyltransferase WcaF